MLRGKDTKFLFQHVFIDGDLAQAEIRVFASLSGDTALKKLIEDGVDIHAYFANIIYKHHLPLEELKRFKDKDNNPVMYAQRSRTKNMVFGTLYGQNAKGAEYTLGIPEAEAQHIIDTFFDLCPQGKLWIDKMHILAQRDGLVRTPLGVIRHLPILQQATTDENRALKAEALRISVNCVDYETEALTRRGWVNGHDLDMSDELLTKNPDTGCLEWQPPQAINHYPDYAGPLWHINSKTFSAVVTPNHRWLVRNHGRRNGSGNPLGRDECKTTEALSLTGRDAIHRTGDYQKDTSSYSDTFVKLAGWFLTDGYVRVDTRSPGFRGVGLCQSQRANPQKVAMIDAILDELGAPVSRRITPRTECVYWNFAGELGGKLRTLFPNRVLTLEFLQDISSDQCKLLLETMMLGDGTEDKKTGKRTFACSNQAKADIFQVLCLLCGVATTAHIRDHSCYTPISEKLLNIPKGKTHHIVTLLSRDRAQVLRKQVEVVEEQRGVWCPTVPNSFFFVRRDGKVYCTGNSPIQTHAADYCAISLLETCNTLDKLKIWYEPRLS